MSRPGRPPRSQQRPLTREDEALWKSVARTLEPVQKKSRIHTRAEPAPGLEDRPEVQISPAFADKVTSAASAAPPRPLEAGQRSASRPQVHKPPPLADFDRRQVRRIAAGRIAIEARLDLHGMRASEAHAALRAFVLGCYARGKRNLLVITGKGGEADRADLPFTLSDRSERGVLKRSVPSWLAEPELRAVVVSYTQAHARHGGEGALYVQLRSQRASTTG